MRASDNFNRGPETLATSANWRTTTAATTGPDGSAILSTGVLFAAAWQTPVASGYVETGFTYKGGTNITACLAMNNFAQGALNPNAWVGYGVRRSSTGSSLEVVEKVSGANSATQIDSFVAATVAGDIISMTYNGTTLEVFKNGVSVGTHNPVSALSLATQQYVGFYEQSTANSGLQILDDFFGGDVSVGGSETTILDYDFEDGSNSYGTVGATLTNVTTPTPPSGTRAINVKSAAANLDTYMAIQNAHVSEAIMANTLYVLTARIYIPTSINRATDLHDNAGNVNYGPAWLLTFDGLREYAQADFSLRDQWQTISAELTTGDAPVGWDIRLYGGTDAGVGLYYDKVTLVRGRTGPILMETGLSLLLENGLEMRKETI